MLTQSLTIRHNHARMDENEQDWSGRVGRNVHAAAAVSVSPRHLATVVKITSGGAIGVELCQAHDDLRGLLYRPATLMPIEIGSGVTGSCGVHSHSPGGELLGERHGDRIQGGLGAAVP